MKETIAVETFGDPRLDDRERYQPVVAFVDKKIHFNQGKEDGFYNLVSPNGSNRTIQSMTRDQLGKHFPNVQPEESFDYDLDALKAHVDRFMEKHEDNLDLQSLLETLFDD